MPLQIAPMACSRMPKWKLRPPYWPASKSPTLVEVQAACCSTGPGRPSRPAARARAWPTWLSTLPDETRLAMPLASAGNGCDVGVPAGGQFAALDQLESARPARDTGPCTRRTSRPTRRAASGPARRCPSRKWARHFAGHQELLVLRPAVGRLRQADFLLAQRRAVGLVACSALFGAPKPITLRTMISVGRSVGLLERLDRRAQAVQIVHVVHLDDVPAVAGEPRGHVFAEGQRRCCPRS